MATGVATFWQITPDGGVLAVTDQPLNFANIQEQMKLLLSVSVGELLNAPTFGTRVREVMHGTLDIHDLSDVCDMMVREGVATWMPYVLIEEVSLEEIDEGTGRNRLSVVWNVADQQFTTGVPL